MTPAQKRRRNVLMILIGAAILSLGLAVLVSPMLWIAHGVADVLLAVYLYLLVLHRRGSLASTVDDDFWGSGPASAAPTGGARASPRSGAPRAGAAPGGFEAAPIRHGLAARAAATVGDRPVRRACGCR